MNERPQKRKKKETLKVLVGLRVRPSTYNALDNLRKHTGLSISELIRSGIREHLLGLNENDLPEELRIFQHNVRVQHKIEVIKKLRQSAYQLDDALEYKKEIQMLNPRYPQHIVTQITQHENEIIQEIATLYKDIAKTQGKKFDLDKWLKKRQIPKYRKPPIELSSIEDVVKSLPRSKHTWTKYGRMVHTIRQLPLPRDQSKHKEFFNWLYDICQFKLTN